MSFDDGELLRQLPAVDAVLRDPRIDRLAGGASRTRIARWVRAAVDACRQTLREATVPTDRNALLDRVVADVLARSEAESARRLQRVINATGVIVHTNLGRAPLCDRAIDAVHEAAGAVNLELDLTTGRRGPRAAALEGLCRDLTGAEAALVVNNCAAATLLALQTLAAGRDVVISRSQLVEIGGSYRLPDVFRTAGVRLCEVGTTNRTRLSDYEGAVGPDTAAILRVHQSNFCILGFTESVPIAPLVELARARGVPAIDDLGSGCLYDLRQYGLDEPIVADSLQAGADLVLFSGDKLLGGPQCGVLLGRREVIQAIRANPLARAVRIDKLTAAALQATLEVHLSGTAFAEIPVLRALAATELELRARAEQVAQAVNDRETGIRAEVVRVESTIGGGALPGQALSGWGVALDGGPPDALAAELRSGRPPVVARIERDRVIVDLRTVHPDEVSLMARCVCETAARRRAAS